MGEMNPLPATLLPLPLPSLIGENSSPLPPPPPKKGAVWFEWCVSVVEVEWLRAEKEDGKVEL